MSLCSGGLVLERIFVFEILWTYFRARKAY